MSPRTIEIKSELPTEICFSFHSDNCQWLLSVVRFHHFDIANWCLVLFLLHLVASVVTTSFCSLAKMQIRLFPFTDSVLIWNQIVYHCDKLISCSVFFKYLVPSALLGNAYFMSSSMSIFHSNHFSSSSFSWPNQVVLLQSSDCTFSVLYLALFIFFNVL